MMQAIKNDYVVHKFGGTSVANAARFIALKSLLTGRNEVIVVSAVQGTTTHLQITLDAAKTGSSYTHLLTHLEEMHLAIANELITSEQKNALETVIKKDFGEIKDILHAVQLTGSYSKEIQDIILGYGELWSAKILASYLGEFNRVIFLDASSVLFIFEKNGMLFIDWAKTQSAMDHFLRDKAFDQIVITGFIAATLQGKRTTLGRNGSDFSGAIFAKLVKASCLTIWTDVDGIYTADPNKVRSAFVIESLSYQEALELAYFGAKVLHPMTIAPVFELKIPVYIKNSFNPTAKGTYISAASTKSSYAIKGLTSIDHVALINIEGAGMIDVSGIAARIFQVLQQKNVSVILIAQASSEYSICFAVSAQHADLAMNALEENLKFEIEQQRIQRIAMDKSCGILSVVGDEMVGMIGVSGKLCSALANANINIRAISQGSSERNISLVLKSKDVTRALRAVHAGFYLSRETISIGIIGPGQVGSALLKQIDHALIQLKETAQANLLIRGIMSSHKMLLSHEAMHLADWQEQFNHCERVANLQEFAEHILVDDMPHAVIIDCTASQEIAKKYIYLIEKGIHVITPNKHANAGDWHYYQHLKSLTQKKSNYYLYETTVCAGLPVINTLQDLIKTGDHIKKIEGIVSGTLSYIFNELAKDRKFSAIVLEAKQRGYTEPDPREDLSGNDVARKLVCLAREMGFAVNLTDVEVFDLVPAELKACSLAEFFAKLPAYDDEMAVRVTKAHAENERVCYVGSIHEDGSMHVALQSFSAQHPFARLKGTDNMLIFHTQRYHEQPLVIQGPGAGADVTAAGIFADLLRLVSFLS